MPMSRTDAVQCIADSVAKLNTRIDAYCTRQDEDDGLTVVRKGTPERGVKIPPPKDPKERAAWEAGVKKREAEGRGRFVGDAAKPAREMSRKEIEAELATGKSNGFGLAGGSVRFQALKTALAEKNMRGED